MPKIVWESNAYTKRERLEKMDCIECFFWDMLQAYGYFKRRYIVGKEVGDFSLRTFLVKSVVELNIKEGVAIHRSTLVRV